MTIYLRRLIQYFLASLILLHAAPSWAETFTASLANMPLSAEVDKKGKLQGAYVELIRAIDQLTGAPTTMKVVPFKRSLKNLISGDADYHIPLIEPPNVDQLDLPYAFSTETLFQVAFVLYTNKNKPLNRAKLGSYRITTDHAHTQFFPFHTKGISCLSCALKMVDLGRVDGFIFAQNEIDPFIKEFGLKNIRRQLYKNFDVKIVIPKGNKGDRLNNYFSKNIQVLKKRGEYDALLAPLLAPYRDWQP